MGQFDQIGPGGVPSYAKPVQINANESVMAQVSRGDVPANALTVLGAGSGANSLGGNRPNQTILRAMSIGHIQPNRPLNAQVATPPASGVSNAGANTLSQVVASLSAGTLTVTGISGTAALGVGVSIVGPAPWPLGLVITALGTGTGGLGTYVCSAPGIAAAALNAASATVVVSPGAGG